jgi:hypothetical protein
VPWRSSRATHAPTIVRARLIESTIKVVLLTRGRQHSRAIGMILSGARRGYYLRMHYPGD